MIPALYVMTHNILQGKLLNYMKKRGAVVISNLIQATVHASMCYFFIDILEQDVLGLSLATLTAFSAKLLFLLTYSCCKKKILETT